MVMPAIHSGDDEWGMRALVTRHDMPPVGLSVANLDAMLA